MRSTDPVVIELQKARIKLLMDWPIFGPIIMLLELKEVDWCPTAATDGRYFFYNREFVKKLDRAQLLFLTAHEVLHVVYNHIFRRGKRNKDLWNMAADFMVNFTLMTAKDSHGGMIGRPIKKVAPVDDILFDKDYGDDFSVEEIYALLEKNAVVVKMPLDMHLDSEKDGKGDEDGDSEGSEGSSGGDDGGEGDDANDGSKGPPKLTEEDIEAIRDNVRATLIQASQQPNVDPGKIPAGILRMLKRLTEPKIDWRQLLDNVLRSSIKHDYSYMRVSRRYYSTGFILPGQDVMEKVSAIAFLDGSGSTTQEMVTDFLSECKGIMDTFQDFELTIATFDTQVYEVKTYTPENADEIHQYPFNGGGGTIPTCCWDYMKEKELEPHKILLFTDGEVGNDWGDPDFGVDALFIVHSNPRKESPWGMTTHFEFKQ